MHSKLTRGVAIAAAIASATVGLVGLGATNTVLAAPPLGTNSLAPASGTTATAFTMLPPSGSSCTGSGSGTPAYRWQTYMVAAAVDASTLTFASGPNPQGSNFVSPLYDSSTGDPVINRNPSASPLGLISGVPTMSFSALVGLVPAGAYKIGFACTLAGAIENGRYWETPITVSNVTATSFSYSFGSVPSAPVLGATLVVGDQTLDGTFTPSPSTPATTGYTVTAVPTAGTTVTLPLAAGVTTFSLTGLVNGTSYAVTVTATNTVGTGAASNVVSGIPNPAPRGPVQFLSAVPGTGNVTLNWTPPTGVAPTGYNIAVSPSVAGAPFTAAAGAVTYTVPGSPGTLYTFTVTPLHASPYVGTAASTTAAPNAAQVIIQNITVERPVGALVLTQRCGVYGELPSEPASTGFAVLPPEPAAGGTTGTSPLLTWPGGAVDPEFGNYPYPAPATYPTHCGINLGTASLVTSGSGAGQYYKASGRINQVTVVDTRDTDPGWTVNGTMSDFVVAGGGASFSGNYLGWTPVVTSDSPATVAGYDQTAIAGPTVLPNNAAGLGTAKVLASAAVADGNGIAVMDARLKLLIPITARNGVYSGTLTFSAI